MALCRDCRTVIPCHCHLTPPTQIQPGVYPAGGQEPTVNPFGDDHGPGCASQSYPDPGICFCAGRPGKENGRD